PMPMTEKWPPSHLCDTSGNEQHNLNGLAGHACPCRTCKHGGVTHFPRHPPLYPLRANLGPTANQLPAPYLEGAPRGRRPASPVENRFGDRNAPQCSLGL